MIAKTWVRGLSWLALTASLLVVPAVALANGAPVKIILGYQEGLSNWGPKGAAGVADIAVGEGIVRVTAAGLPHLEGQAYEGWLIDTRTGEKFSTGRFNAENDGSVKYEQIFERIPDKRYDLYLLSIVGQDQQTTEPTAQVSIAGYFPVLKPSNGEARPAELPYTGPEVNGLALASALLIGGVLGFGLRSMLQRRGGRP